MIFFTRRFLHQPSVTFLEFIESNGTQYIDTGFNPNQNARIQMQCFFTNTSPEFSAMFGAREGNNNQFWAYYARQNSRFQARYGTQTLFIEATLHNPDICDFNKTICKINDVQDEANEQQFQSKYSVFLFGVNSSGRIQYPSSMKFFSCQISEGGDLIHSYLPAKDPDGIACLYDSVLKEYVYNAGSGNFTAGPEA